MKRTYVSPEFEYRPAYGTFNMKETSGFFGSKMLDLEDEVNILNENLAYTQLENGEQMDEAAEANSSQILYDSTVNKQVNHVLSLDGNQSDFQKENSAKWTLRVEIKDILRNHLFATLKKYRTFEGLRPNLVLYNNVDLAIFEYINTNILSRYAFTRADLFVEYVDLCGDGQLQYKNEYNPLIEASAKPATQPSADNVRVSDFTTQLSPDENFLDISFTQKKPAFAWSYRYYFNLYFTKL
jgi:hypothetical protein